MVSHEHTAQLCAWGAAFHVLIHVGQELGPWIGACFDPNDGDTGRWTITNENLECLHAAGGDGWRLDLV